MHGRRLALEYTKEIVVAKLSNSGVQTNGTGGEHVAAFFEEIYRKISALEGEEMSPKDD